MVDRTPSLFTTSASSPRVVLLLRRIISIGLPHPRIALLFISCNRFRRRIFRLPWMIRRICRIDQWGIIIIDHIRRLLLRRLRMRNLRCDRVVWFLNRIFQVPTISLWSQESLKVGSFPAFANNWLNSEIYCKVRELLQWQWNLPLCVVFSLMCYTDLCFYVVSTNVNFHNRKKNDNIMRYPRN